MKFQKGLSTIEFILLLIVLGVVAYVVVPRYINLEPENIEAKWQQTKQKAEHVSETLSNKATYDRIEQEMGKSE
jgi:Tfp pilus assembly protein PilE